MTPDHTQRRVRIKTAMEAVGLEQMRFNEIVNAGYYDCAPPTVRGKVRTFAETDLIGLYVFARLMESGMAIQNAGSVACRMITFLAEFASVHRKHYDEPRLVYIVGHVGSAFVSEREFKKLANPQPGVGAFLYTTHFEIATIRKLVNDAVDELLLEVGEGE